MKWLTGLAARRVVLPLVAALVGALIDAQLLDHAVGQAVVDLVRTFLEWKSW